MRAASQAFRDQLKANPTFTQTLTANIPGEGALDLQLAPSGLVVESTAGQGPRSNVNNIEVTSFDVQSRELWDLLQRPGATFDASISQRVGADDLETIPVFHGYAASGSTRIVESAVQLSLVDPWAWVEGVPFGDPVVIPEITRAAFITQIVSEVIPGLSVKVTDLGGSMCVDGTALTATRTQTISDIATEGRLDVYFDAQGVLVIRTMPEVSVGTLPVDTLATGSFGTIVAGTGTRSRDFLRIYNAVRVSSANPDVVYDAVTVRLADESSWAHESKIGFRPYDLKSKTIANATEAEPVAYALLQRLLKGQETADVTVVINPLLEVGDAVDIASSQTATDPGFGKTYLLTATSIDTSTGTTVARGNDSILFETEVS